MTNPRRRLRCLLVDDDPAWLLLIKSIAGEENLTFCSNSKVALEHILKERPEILITDTNMPKVSGLDLVRQVRERPELNDMPILVLSSRHHDETVNELYNAGATAVMSKDDFLARYHLFIGKPSNGG